MTNWPQIKELAFSHSETLIVPARAPPPLIRSSDSPSPSPSPAQATCVDRHLGKSRARADVQMRGAGVGVGVWGKANAEFLGAGLACVGACGGLDRLST
jgi:hypothetical protein